MNAKQLLSRYRTVRAFTEALIEPLGAEDMTVQTMPDVSPTKWHLAHTTWFFETFVLAKVPGQRPHHPAFAVLFNSYYQGVGPQHPRPERGLLSRPTVEEILGYRAAIDLQLEARLETGDLPEALLPIVEIGLHHEAQHQELLLTDIKHVLGTHPLWPAYRDTEAGRGSGETATPLSFQSFDLGLVEVGHQGAGFAYDNEGPRHSVFLAPFALASRLVTCGEYLEFMENGAYDDPTPWLSDGWNTVQARGLRAPLYWRLQDGSWWLYTLGGARPIDPAEPVTHLSYYEAEAYARFAGARLPSEFEWEAVAAKLPVEGVFAEGGRLHPAPELRSAASLEPDASGAASSVQGLFGNVWEWTHSAYAPYPGYQAVDGALGEYNGKFMCSQQVLRGGACVTPSPDHLRPTYRNFFPPDARWQFSGLRLARDTT